MKDGYNKVGDAARKRADEKLHDYQSIWNLESPTARFQIITMELNAIIPQDDIKFIRSLLIHDDDDDTSSSLNVQLMYQHISILIHSIRAILLTKALNNYSLSIRPELPYFPPRHGHINNNSNSQPISISNSISSNSSSSRVTSA
jgi:hypothetical protein